MRRNIKYGSWEEKKGNNKNVCCLRLYYLIPDVSEFAFLFADIAPNIINSSEPNKEMATNFYILLQKLNSPSQAGQGQLILEDELLSFSSEQFNN